MIDLTVFVPFRSLQRPFPEDQILIDMIIRNDRLPLIYVLHSRVFQLLEPVAEKEHLKLEAPVVHILIELVQKRILVDNFFNDRKLQFGGEHRGEGGFTGSNRAFHGYKGACFINANFLLKYGQFQKQTKLLYHRSAASNG